MDKTLEMFVVNRTRSTIAHMDFENDSVCRKPGFKPDANTAINQNNVILFAAAIKPKKHVHRISFKYPLLECP